MWVAEHQYEILGTRFGVRSDDAGVAVRVERLLDPFRIPDVRPLSQKNQFALAASRPDDQRHHAFRDCRMIGRSDSWTHILDSFLANLNRRAIEEMAFLGVHAGVVASGSRTIALPAASGAGKTTLVAACLQHGFDYLSDESLCLDYTNGAVIPYPKPLNLTPWSLEKLGLEMQERDGSSKAPLAPAELGTVVSDPRQLTDVVLAERRPGPSELGPLPASETLGALLRYSFNHYKNPAATFKLATELARQCQGWALYFEDPADAAELLATELAESVTA